ncbi:MAG: putative 4-hydroxybenzoate polyprenyltransferase [Gemmatimonadales bacterium]|nr:putative 4-hydroxybenzoate polyprenyltransferase [Gemmatimonadales bacterium]
MTSNQGVGPYGDTGTSGSQVTGHGSPREGQTFTGGSALARWASFVKLPHTLFALPFALLGVLAASRVAPVTWGTVAWVALAFSSARFAAMGFNRIVDRAFDAKNPRTKARELPSGAIAVGTAKAAVVVAAALFMLASWQLNPLCLYLSPIALAWVLGYSYAKRFTSWPHLWLGLSLAIAPVGGWIAVTGAWSTPWWLLLVITVGVMTWVAGFDVFYALPDEGFDRDQGLRSAVVRLGQTRAIFFGKLLHGITIPALAVFGWGAGFGLWYYVGVAVAAAILTYEHQLVKPGDLSRLDAAFFTMNGVMSVTVFVFALVDVVVR